MVVDSRSLRFSPGAWARGFDGGKLVKGIKLFVACDKHGSLLDLELHRPTMPAGMAPRAWSSPRGSALSSCRPTRPNSSPQSISGGG